MPTRTGSRCAKAELAHRIRRIHHGHRLVVANASRSPRHRPRHASASRQPRPAEQRAAPGPSPGCWRSSVTDRTAISNAYDDVGSCGAESGPRTRRSSTRAVSSRRAILASLATMPGRAALPAGLARRPHQGLAGVGHGGDQGLCDVGQRRGHPGLRHPEHADDPGYSDDHRPRQTGSSQYKDRLHRGAGLRLPSRCGLTTYYQRSQLGHQTEAGVSASRSRSAVELFDRRCRTASIGCRW